MYLYILKNLKKKKIFLLKNAHLHPSHTTTITTFLNTK